MSRIAFVTVTDHEHLTASGRAEDHEKAPAAPLSVKPIVTVTDGIPKAVVTGRTQGAALKEVLDLAQESVGTTLPVRMAVDNGNVASRDARWVDEAAQALGFTGQPYLVDFGPALAVHLGPGLLGVTGQWE